MPQDGWFLPLLRFTATQKWCFFFKSESLNLQSVCEETQDSDHSYHFTYRIHTCFLFSQDRNTSTHSWCRLNWTPPYPLTTHSQVNTLQERERDWAPCTPDVVLALKSPEDVSTSKPRLGSKGIMGNRLRSRAAQNNLMCRKFWKKPSSSLQIIDERYWPVGAGAALLMWADGCEIDHRRDKNMQQHEVPR